MQTQVKTEEGKQRTVDWEPCPLAAALGPEWEWRPQVGKDVRLNHPSGLWTRLPVDLAFEEDYTEVALTAGALKAAAEAGITGLVIVTVSTDNLGDGTLKRSSWVVGDETTSGPVFSLLALDPAGVSGWTDEKLLARHVSLMTEAAECLSTDTEPSKLSADVARRVEDALEGRGYYWDSDETGWRLPL